MKRHSSMEEKWKSINKDGFNHYIVSSSGRVFNMNTGVFLNGYKNESGYARVKLSSLGKTFQFYIHRLVMEVFKPPADPNLEVHHKNDIRDDNRLENLEWVTHSVNMGYRWKTMREKMGSQVPEPIDEEVEDLPF